MDSNLESAVRSEILGRIPQQVGMLRLKNTTAFLR